MNLACSRIREVEVLVWQKPQARGRWPKHWRMSTLDGSLGKLKMATGMLASLNLKLSMLRTLGNARRYFSGCWFKIPLLIILLRNILGNSQSPWVWSIFLYSGFEFNSVYPNIFHHRGWENLLFRSQSTWKPPRWLISLQMLLGSLTTQHG